MQLETDHQATDKQDPVRRSENYNPETLDALFSRHRAQLYMTALRITRNHEDAEDALQDGLMSAFCHFGSFEGRSQCVTWLTRIVVNAALMRLRRKRCVVMTSIDQGLGEEDQPLANRIPEPGLNPEELCAQKEQLRIFEQAFQSLPSIYQQAIWLRDFQELSTRETAELLGVQIGNLKARLWRARRRLCREAINPQSSRRLLRNARKVVAAMDQNFEQGLTEVEAELDAYFSAHAPGKS